MKSRGLYTKITEIFSASRKESFPEVNTQPSRWSYVHGASDRPLIHKTVAQILQGTVEAVPNKDAFVLPHRDYHKTYLELWDESRRLARGLLYLGLRPGDRLAIWSPNCYEWVLTQYAAARAGIILVSVNSAYKTAELKHVMEKVGAKGLIAPFEHRQAQYYKMMTQLIPEIEENPNGIGHLHHNVLPALKHFITFDYKFQTPTFKGAWNFWQLVEAGGERESVLLNKIDKELSPDDILAIMFTSGKTGRPKASALTHHNVLNNALSVGRRMGLNKERQNICVPVPLHGAFGAVLGSLNSVLHYSTCVLPCSRFSASGVLQSIQDRSCSVVLSTPTMFIDMLNDPKFKQYNLNSLKTALVSGAKCQPRLCKEIVSNFGLQALHKLYGTTEVSPAAFMTIPNDQYDTVGNVLDHIEAKVIDAEGRKAIRGEIGELCIRGYSVMSGYWSEEQNEKNRGVEPDRWYRTGDLAKMNDDGTLIIEGRVKNVINRGGEAVYARELEVFLLSHPAVADAHVIGVRDERLGEEICAWIQLKDGAENTTVEHLIKYCKSQLAHFKVPRYVIFKRDFEFPKLETGKIDKEKMRKLSEKTLGIH
ncbi:unnamed protein product [Bursaphelenchus xylophilus]|uniref:Medium-chain acyl-CoA ligase ACSF2, mitochondrial n=1 Tax=Bursaphelenchus xylophilus TaxID=6326 RepID=A0A1I7S3T5_BURXY|nr:unnamed protein product [Bursaphelenchus xylophilus]CAG9116507.1 unnamed protein product [Bursaphelenchus xylophilus]